MSIPCLLIGLRVSAQAVLILLAAALSFVPFPGSIGGEES